MKFEKYNIDELEKMRSNYNPRMKLKQGDKEYEKLKKSILEFGYAQPIIINRKGKAKNIIAGHQRLTVLKDLGYSEIDCIILSLDKKKEKQLNIALNKISGNWDDDKLRSILLELEEQSKEDVFLTGFDEDEYNELLEKLDEDININNDIKEDNFDIDKAEEEISEPFTKNGYIYKLGNHRLMCGDSTCEEDVKLLLDGNNVDMIFTDPPYGVDYSSKNEMLNKFDEGNRIKKEIINDNIIDYRKFFYDFLNIIPFSEYNIFYISMFGQELHNLRLAIEDCNYKWSDYLIWVKNNHVLGRKDYNAKHEFIVYGWKGKHKFYGEFSTTILEYNKPLKNDLHPTMKPIELISKLINDGSKKEMNIYDGFGGSGSTLIACEQTNRKCFMMELDEKYCDVIIKRYINFKENADVFLIDNDKKIQLIVNENNELIINHKD